MFFFFFFFQAEDGIRDVAVTGVQTCALPIFIWGSKKRNGATILITKFPIMSESTSCTFVVLGTPCLWDDSIGPGMMVLFHRTKGTRICCYSHFRELQARRTGPEKLRP